ncbi:MAG: hypothetical protein RLZZ69_856, partial [Cyanobacteriota bacterium]
YSLNQTRIEAIFPPDMYNHQLSLLKSKSSDRDLKHQDSQKKLSVISSLEQQPKTNVIVANNTDLVASNSDKKELSARLIKPISLSFFFLFFVPLGIFYPLFLFYKMLLSKPDESEDILNSDRQTEFTEPIDVIHSVLQAEPDVNQATVSKLQIAFSPPASHLREELIRVSAMAHLNLGDDLVDLMHQTVAVLIEQGHWTHASYSSLTLPLEKVKLEFDFIFSQERAKLLSETPSLVNQNRNVITNDGYHDYSYVVVTLILCSSDTVPLFKQINTKEQLLQILSQLGKMKRDSVIKFELLWNPQPEGVYLNNTQLLTEYAEMTRLL